jgi:ankyrin repeat protein
VKLFLAHASSAPCDASSLCIAVQNGHDEIVRCMLTSAGSWTPTPETPLLMAAELGHANILRLLLEAGGHGDPGEALCLAAGRGHVAAATMLLHFRAEVNHRIQGLGLG